MVTHLAQLIANARAALKRAADASGSVTDPETCDAFAPLLGSLESVLFALDELHAREMALDALAQQLEQTRAELGALTAVVARQEVRLRAVEELIESGAEEDET